MWHMERSLWVPERKLYYGFPVPGVVSSAGGGGASTPGSTGFVIAGTGTNVNDGGNTAWSNPERVTADDVSNAAANIFTVGNTTQRLVASNFSLSAVPDGSTITSIIARWQIQQQTNNGDVHTEQVLQLSLDAGSTLFGDNKASGAAWPTTTTNKDFTFNTTLPTAAQVKSANFAVVLKGVKSSGAAVSNAMRVDAVWVDVSYLA